MDISVIVMIQLTLQGLINHFGFFTVLSASQSIAIEFDRKNEVSIMIMLCSIASMCMLFLNAVWFVKYSPKNRIFSIGFTQAVGYILIGIGWTFNFHIVFAGAIFIGMGVGFGEASHLGYLKVFPSKFIGPFVSGTGLWGLTSSLLYVFLHANEIPNWLIFLCSIPLAIIYLINFATLWKFSEANDYFHDKEENKLIQDINNEDNMSELQIVGFRIYSKAFQHLFIKHNYLTFCFSKRQ